VQTATLAYRRVATGHHRDTLILEHMWLVRHVVGRLRGRLPQGVDVENLEAAGVLGLVEAAQKYDAERGVRFDTYAYGRVRGAILDELRRNCPLPQHVLERVARLRQAMRTLHSGASIESLAAEAGLSLDEATDCLTAMRLTRTLSLDRNDAALGDEAMDVGSAPEREVVEAERKRMLAEAIERLPERERLVLTLYYMEELRLREIAEVLGLSESRVSRLLSAALSHVGAEVRDGHEVSAE
jgi:RNA polymerase sigma factor for flagellar operon FliA